MNATEGQLQDAVRVVVNKAYRAGFNDGIQFVVDSLRDAAAASTVDVYAAIQRELANMFEAAKLKPIEEEQDPIYNQIDEGDAANEQQSN